jgi:prophage tail gpP-like protein
MPRPTEIAELVVNGQRFRDWTSVTVQHRHLEDFPIFKFEATEKEPLPPRWALLQFKEGDAVEIFLAGHLAMTGHITTRQVAYDKDAHGVQLIGKGATVAVAKSSVRTKTGSFDGYSWTQIARSVCGALGVNLKTVGKLDNTPFERCQHNPASRHGSSSSARAGSTRSRTS